MNKEIHYWAGINKYFKLNIDRVLFCASWHQRYNYSTGRGHCSTYTRVPCVQYDGFSCS